jgi:hypothetical protein
MKAFFIRFRIIKLKTNVIKTEAPSSRLINETKMQPKSEQELFTNKMRIERAMFSREKNSKMDADELEN